jgi:DNA-binding XRE family transcriptional regulator
LQADVARFFQELRAAHQLSQAEAAQRLSTRIAVICALEAGDVSDLPPWPECCRVVRTYTGFMGLDPRPILHLLEVLLAAGATAPKPVPKRTLFPQLKRPTTARPQQRGSNAAGPGLAVPAMLKGLLLSPKARAGRILFAIAVPVGLLVLLTQSSVLQAAVAQLPPRMARIVRGAQDYVTVQLAPVRDGLRWIDVRDPRSRRSDKLRTAAQSD